MRTCEGSVDAMGFMVRESKPTNVIGVLDKGSKTRTGREVDKK